MDRIERIERRISLHDIRVLMSVIQAGSMGKAAERLATSQPAVSRSISDLEHTLGVRLLDRSPQGIEPTPYGNALVKRGVAVFDELKLGIKDIEFLADPTAGELRIGSNVALATSFVSTVIERLSRRYPRITVHLLAGETAMTYRALKERSVDLAIVHIFSPISEEQLHADILYDEPSVIVADARSPWIRRRKLELAELVNAVWVLPPLDSLHGSVIAEAFRACGLDVPRAAVITSNVPVRNALLATGRFLTIVPCCVLKFPPKKPVLKVLPIELPTTRKPVGIITLKNRTLNPVAKLFIDCAREVANRPPKRK